MKPALWKGWAVVIKPTRGTEWSHSSYCAPTRSRAIADYNKDWSEPDQYARHRKAGEVRCIRVELRPSAAEGK